MSSIPTQRTLAELRKRGWIAQVVERWNPYAKRRIDLFGCIDLVAIAPAGGIVAIQTCAGCDHAKRREKILMEPRARRWIEEGGKLEIWSWAKQGARGKRKLWTLRVESVAVADFESERIAA